MNLLGKVGYREATHMSSQEEEQQSPSSPLQLPGIVTRLLDKRNNELVPEMLRLASVIYVIRNTTIDYDPPEKTRLHKIMQRIDEIDEILDRYHHRRS